MANNQQYQGETWYEKAAKIVVILASVSVVIFVFLNMSGKMEGARSYVLLSLGAMLFFEGLSMLRRKKKLARALLLFGILFAATKFLPFLNV